MQEEIHLCFVIKSFLKNSRSTTGYICETHNLTQCLILKETSETRLPLSHNLITYSDFLPEDLTDV